MAGLVFRPSPHVDARPAGLEAPELVVLHGISLPEGRYGGSEIDDLFMGRLLQPPLDRPELADLAGLRVSSHFLIRRGGATVQYVDTAQRAWHAGVSSFGGRERCNDFSIGIELEGCDADGYEDPQYAALVALLQRLTQEHPSLRAIAGHCHIAPGRKTDPGPHFDWGRLDLALRKAGVSLTPPQP